MGGCENGDGVDPCPRPNINDCAKCDPGFQIKKQQGHNICVEIPSDDGCWCDNGTAATDPSVCKRDGWHTCQKCDPGYELFDKGKRFRCRIIPICTCFKGTPVDSEDCPRHQRSWCQACDTGYKLKGGKNPSKGCVPEKEP